jgi:predicted nucleotide-binding protein
MSEKPDEEKKRPKPPRPFPKQSLQEALKVAQAIQNGNNGKPMKTIFIAKAIDLSPQSTNFRDVTSASYKYGLTIGTVPNVDTISLTPLGSSLTKPTDPIKEVKDRQEAVMKIEVFKNIFEHYRNGKFPAGDTYFKNMLEDSFHVPPEYVDECIALLQENGQFANIFSEVKGSLYVAFSDEPVVAAEASTTEESIAQEEPSTEPEVVEIPAPAPAQTKPIANQIFIVHGKDHAPVEQLKNILLDFKVPFKIAVDEPNIGRPISQKVSELMKSCTSAIVIFTADEEYTGADGKKIFKPSDNAVYELGAASILYEDRIVILKEESVTLSSDFSDLGHITFKKDELEAKSMQLIKELIGFGLLKFTPA